MRKITIEFQPNDASIKELKPVFEKVQSYEILETLKIDYEEGICVDLIECQLREGLSIDDVGNIGKMEILNVLKTEGTKHTCLVKYRESEDNMDSFKEMDLDLINTTPTIISEEKITFSCIGENENLNKLIEILKTEGMEIVNMSFKRAIYEKKDLLSVLTAKQRDILITAHKHGYYKYPKKINSEQLSKKVEIGKATFVQHLRKAEERILDEIMEGYSD